MCIESHVQESIEQKNRIPVPTLKPRQTRNRVLVKVDDHESSPLIYLKTISKTKNTLLLHLFHNFCNTIKDEVITGSPNGSNYTMLDHTKSTPRLGLIT